MSKEIETGQVLDGRFKIDEVICRGGMATVFKATEVGTGLLVAVKAPYFQYESDPAFYS